MIKCEYYRIPGLGSRRGRNVERVRRGGMNKVGKATERQDAWRGGEGGLANFFKTFKLNYHP